MAFFQEYWNWLQTMLANYVASNAATVAMQVAPAVVTLATVFVAMWGYLMLTGQIQDLIVDGFRRIVTIAVIIGIGVNLWLYNGPIVDTFFQAPFDLAAAMVGAQPISLLDQIWNNGFEVGKLFWANGGLWNGDVGMYLVAIFVWLITGLLTLYSMFLMAIARIALSVLLALGPFFIAMLFFDTTKRFFEAWIAQLANYGFVAILTGLVGALILKIVDTFAAATVGVGASLAIADATYFLLSTVLAFLLMRQVMPIAAGLASGIALSTGNLVSRAAWWGLGGIGNMSRGMLDAVSGGGTTRWDPMTRKTGYYATRAVVRGGQTLIEPAWRRRTPKNTLRQKSSP